MRSILYAIAVLCGFSLLLAGCDTNSGGPTGTFRVLLTDMPFPFDDAEAANVVIERIELRGGDDEDNVIVLSDSMQYFNLLDLRDGVTLPIAVTAVPVDNYSQLRVIVLEDASVVMKDSSRFDLKIPSGSQTGIKINLPEFDFGEADVVEVIVDFDVAESFVVRGNPATTAEINGFIFKPVLKITDLEINEIDTIPVEQ